MWKNGCDSTAKETQSSDRILSTHLWSRE